MKFRESLALACLGMVTVKVADPANGDWFDKAMAVNGILCVAAAAICVVFEREEAKP